MQSATKKRDFKSRSTKVRETSTVNENMPVIAGKHLLKIPSIFTLALFLLSFTSRVQSNDVLIYSFWASCLALLAWQGWLLKHCATQKTEKSFIVALKPQHYIQAMVQLSVYVYWGMNWQPVKDHAVLLIAQIMFAYSFDILLSWTRRESNHLGFGPSPIIFRQNLFWGLRVNGFYLKYMMVRLVS